jgi:hypothetical protein
MGTPCEPPSSTWGHPVNPAGTHGQGRKGPGIFTLSPRLGTQTSPRLPWQVRRSAHFVAEQEEDTGNCPRHSNHNVEESARDEKGTELREFLCTQGLGRRG